MAKSCLSIKIFILLSCTNAIAQVTNQSKDCIVARSRSVTVKCHELQENAIDAKGKSDHYRRRVRSAQEVLDQRHFALEAVLLNKSESKVLEDLAGEKGLHPTDAEVNLLLELRSRKGNAFPFHDKDSAYSWLKEIRVRELQESYRNSLREKYGAYVSITPPGITFDVAFAPSKSAVNPTVKVVVFSDFECPYCALLSKSFQSLDSDLSNELDVKFVHFPLPMHKNATFLAKAAICADTRRAFWPFHDNLFATVLRSPKTAASFSELVQWSNMSPQELKSCVDNKHTEARLSQNIELARQLGITSTPTVIIEGEFIEGSMSLPELKELIQRHINVARGSRN